MQNLPRNYITELDACRDDAKKGDLSTFEMLWGDAPGMLSQLIRTAFVPKSGMKFVVSDFSAIEARVLSWFACENGRAWPVKNGA